MTILGERIYLLAADECMWKGWELHAAYGIIFLAVLCFFFLPRSSSLPFLFFPTTTLNDSSACASATFPPSFPTVSPPTC